MTTKISLDPSATRSEATRTLAPGSKGISIRFESPVTPRAAQSAIRIVPYIPGLVTLSSDGMEAVWEPTGTIRPGDYKVLVEDVVDVNGRRLRGRQQDQFTVTDDGEARRLTPALAELAVPPGHVLLHRATISLRMGKEVLRAAKVLDPTSGRAYELCVDSSGRSVDLSARLSAEAEAYVERHGRIHPPLRRAAELAGEFERVPVAVWLAVEERPADKEKVDPKTIAKEAPELLTYRQVIQEAQQRFLKSLDADDKRAQRAEGIVVAGTMRAAPVVFLELTPAQIHELSQREDVAGLFLHETRGIPDLVNSMAASNADDVVDVQGWRGTNIRVGVWEGSADDLTFLDIADHYDDDRPGRSDHTRLVTAIIKNTEGREGHVGPRIDTRDWSSGWTSAIPFEVGGAPYLFLLKYGDGHVHVHRFDADGTIGPEVTRYDWSSGWSTVAFYETGGSTYLFLLKAGNGHVHVHRMNGDGSVGPRVDTRDWSSGWTSAVPFTVGGQPYLFLLKQGNGHVHIHQINADGTIGGEVTRYDWSSGWSTVSFYTVGGSTYLFLLKESDGTVHIHQMNADGSVGTRVDTRNWSEGWTQARAFTAGGQSFLFLLKEGSGLVHIHALDNDGRVGARVARYDWSSGWSTAAFYTIAGETFLFLLKASNGVVHVHLMSAGPQPNGYAPDSKVFGANSYSLDALEWAVLDKECRVINQSFHRHSEPASADLSFDDIVKDYLVLHYPYPTIVQAAGNYWLGDEDDIDPPSDEFVNHKGYNSLTVGNHNDGVSAMSGTSVFRNPTTPHDDRELPEICANGTVVGAVGTSSSGTSFASPAVAGSAALLQNIDNTLLVWPEGVRAILMAGARRNVSGNTWAVDLAAGVDGADGAGALDIEEAGVIAAHRAGRDNHPSMRGWDVGTLRDADFDGSGLSRFSYQIATPRDRNRRHLKVALAWDGEVTRLLGIPIASRLGVDFDLHVFDGNQLVASSASWDNSYEIAELTADPGKTYTVRIRRWSGRTDTWYGIAWSVI